MGKSDTIPAPMNARGPSDLALRQPYLPQPWAAQPQEDDAETALTLSDLAHIVLKHKWTLLVVVILSVTIATINTFLIRPTYRATTVLQIDRTPQRVVDFNNSVMDLDQMVAEESNLRTQYELLRSRSLAERVIDDLKLHQFKGPATTPSMAGMPASATASAAPPDGFVERIINGYRKLSTPSSNDAQLLSREGVVGSFLGALSVDPVPNSRLVKLSVDNADPKLAALIANTTAQTFVALGQERRIESTSYAKNFLEEQIVQMKAKLEESERKLNTYAQQKQILTLDEKTNVLNQTYLSYADALGKAEQERIRYEMALAEAKVNPESASRGQESSKALTGYKEMKAKLEVEYQQNLRTYKPDYPKMQQLRAQIQELDVQLKGEFSTLISVVKSQYDAARQIEAELRDKVAKTRQEVLISQESGIEFNLLKREVDTNRQLYDGLLQRLKQVGVVSNVSNNNVSIVDAATQPLFPYKPNLHSNVMAGLGIGLFFGLCLVFLLEYMDDSVKFPDELERTLGLPLMGVIPLSDKKRASQAEVGLSVHSDPRSTLAEAYRSVRTALQFSTSHGAPRRLLITSTTRDEGKSTTALALAINFSQMGHRVLLVDADMRNPTAHKMLNMPNEMGLSNFLSADSVSETLIQPTIVPNLSVLTAGPPPPNPVDLLAGPKLLGLLDKAGEFGFTHVVVDGPPILGIADSIVLANQIEDVLFIVRARSTRKSNIRDALRRLRLAGLQPRGAVLTFTPARELQGYGSYYGYGGYGEPLPRQPALARDA
jgi:succinoglycan biosynthesis transport protein ExoP